MGRFNKKLREYLLSETTVTNKQILMYILQIPYTFLLIAISLVSYLTIKETELMGFELVGKSQVSLGEHIVVSIATTVLCLSVCRAIRLWFCGLPIKGYYIICGVICGVLFWLRYDTINFFYITISRPILFTFPVLITVFRQVCLVAFLVFIINRTSLIRSG